MATDYIDADLNERPDLSYVNVRSSHLGEVLGAIQKDALAPNLTDSLQSVPPLGELLLGL